MSNTLAATLAAFVAGLEGGDVPADVREAAHWHIVDLLGVCIAAANPREDSGAVARRLAADWRAPGATILGIASQCRPEAAALLNGALAQALEMDDKHGSSLARPASTVIPAVLAVAESRDLSLADAITAVVVGYEVMIRLGFVAGKRFLARGYHTSALLGGFGCAAAIGRLFGQPSIRIVDALGIAGTFAAGIQESTRTGSTSKILHGGWGAHSGIIASELASAGITGPTSVFEGRFGFFHSHLGPIEGQLDWQTPVEGLGSRWHMPETAYKPYPCCQLLHAFIEAAKQLRHEMTKDGIVPDQISRLTCRLAEPGLTLVTEPRDSKRAPQTPHEARFSLPYVVAATFVHGLVDLDTFRPKRLADERVRRLAQRAEWGEDPDSDYPLHCPAVLDVEAGGKLYQSRVPFHPGSHEAPLSQDDVLNKFARNTTWLLGDRAREIGATLAGMPQDAPVRDLIARLGAAAEAASPVGA